MRFTCSPARRLVGGGVCFDAIMVIYGIVSFRRLSLGVGFTFNDRSFYTSRFGPAVQALGKAGHGPSRTHNSNQPIGQKRIYFIQRTLFSFLASFLPFLPHMASVGTYVQVLHWLSFLLFLNRRRAMVTDVSRLAGCQLRA